MELITDVALYTGLFVFAGMCPGFWGMTPSLQNAPGTTSFLVLDSELLGEENCPVFVANLFTLTGLGKVFQGGSR